MLRFFRQCSQNVQTVQTIFRMFRVCSDFSDNVQNMFRQCSEFPENVQNFQKIFRIFRQCSECVQTFSEFLAQKLGYSEFHDFVVIHSHFEDIINIKCHDVAEILLKLFSDVYLHKIMFSCLFITFIVSMARRINYNSISIGIRRLDKQERSSALLLHNKGTLIIGK